MLVFYGNASNVSLETMCVTRFHESSINKNGFRSSLKLWFETKVYMLHVSFEIVEESFFSIQFISDFFNRLSFLEFS
jgi:hypothetical protein